MTADLVGAARALVPLVQERAAQAEADRRLPGDLVAAFTHAGLFRMLVPAVYGGPQADPLELLEVVEIVSAADGAAGWCVNIASTTSSMSWYLQPDWAARIYGDPATVTGGAFAPTGRGREVEGGFVIDEGHWAWGSGTQHCQWINCGVLTDDGGFHLMFVPAEEVEFQDTWYAAGLRGTGSLDFEVHGCFVPAGRELQPGRTATRVDEPLCHFPNFGLLAAGLGAVTVGIAQRAVDELVMLAGARTPMLSKRTLAHQAYAQLDLARAAACVAGARAYLHDQVGSMWHKVLSGHRATISERAEIRLACHHVAAEAARAVDLAYTAAGGASVYSSSPLQRCLRDIHVATQHMMLSARNLETYAKVRCGLEADLSTL